MGYHKFRASRPVHWAQAPSLSCTRSCWVTLISVQTDTSRAAQGSPADPWHLCGQGTKPLHASASCKVPYSFLPLFMKFLQFVSRANFPQLSSAAGSEWGGWVVLPTPQMTSESSDIWHWQLTDTFPSWNDNTQMMEIKQKEAKLTAAIVPPNESITSGKGLCSETAASKTGCWKRTFHLK